MRHHNRPRTSTKLASRIVELFGLHFGLTRPLPIPCAPGTSTGITWGVWHLLLLLLLPAAVRAQFTYTTNNGTITIRGGCHSGAAVIPSTINGLPVTSIGDYAFFGCTSLTTVTILNSVTSMMKRNRNCSPLTRLKSGAGGGSGSGGG